MQLMVIQDSDRTKVGEIEAQAGMELANGYKVVKSCAGKLPCAELYVKVNDKSAIAEHDGHSEKFFDPTSIFYTEAITWGFSAKAEVDRKAENLAASVRRFERGEEAYQKFQEYGCVLQLFDPLEKAGYDFAKEVFAQRQSAIFNSLVAQLETAEGEVSTNFLLTFEVETPTSEYKMFRTFETESENLARDEAIEMEWQLCSENAKVLFEKLEACE